MSEKRLVVSMACGEKSRKFSDITFPLIQQYARKCDADFYAMYQVDENYKYLGQQKYKYANFLDQYERILHIDADMIVKYDTPNLFNKIKVHEFAGVDEHKFEDPEVENPYVNRYQDMLDFNKYINDTYGTETIITPKFYINVGMYLFSRHHANMFQNKQELPIFFKEQTEINFNLHRFNHSVQLLSPNFNFMKIMENKGLSKDDAFIIHYAGSWGGYSDEMIAVMMREELNS